MIEEPINPVYVPYAALVRQQLGVEPELWSFKSHPTYRGILEHVSKDQGVDYMELIINKVKDKEKLSTLLDLFKKNDLYGKPLKEELPTVGYVSPTNARYLYHALLIADHYKTLNTKNIIEIGGGYGGLGLFLKSMLDCNYHIFDLPDVMKLQEKYLNLHNIECKFLDFNSKLPDDFFIVSNYCYSELRDNHILEQYKKIIDMSDGGFMAWNALAQGGYVTIDETFKNKNVTINPENPLTGPGNLEIYWETP